jgi:tetratricopeptide (TPR) repeat protein
VALGDFEAAEEAFGRGLATGKDCAELEIAYGVHLAEQDRYGPAKEHLLEALRLTGTEPELHVHLGRVHAAEGDRRRALHHLRKAVRAGHPRGVELADDLAGPGRSEELVRRLDEAVEQSAGEQVPLLKGLLREEASFAEARIRLGIALVARGKPRAAEKEFRRALKVEPEDPEAWSGLATALKARRKFERAIEAHEQAIRRAPRQEAYHLNLADSLLRAGRVRDAARAVDRARALNPNHPLLPGFTVAVKQMLSERSLKEEG